jgi:hypothetical protein
MASAYRYIFGKPRRFARDNNKSALLTELPKPRHNGEVLHTTAYSTVSS